MTALLRPVRGLGMPLATLLVGFLVGAVAVIVAGGNPLIVYKQLAEGAGLRWLLQWVPGNPFDVTTREATIAATNLQSTILVALPILLTGLAVGFAFRCGVFNIGAGGQLVMGAIAGWFVAYHLDGPLGMVLGTGAGMLAGFLYGAIPGALRAYRGAHEVISTIMLNFIALYFGRFLVEIGGPLQDAASFKPFTDQLPEGSRYPTFWGEISTNQVHIGVFLALLAAFAYWLVLERTTLGYDVKAVGANPEAARYGGINVKRAIVLAMAIAGAFSGLAGAGEAIGRYYQLQDNTLTGTMLNYGFTGIAVALLGRNKAVGIVLAALLFAALDAGARSISGEVDPQVARALATIIQGTVILFVGGEALLRRLAPRRRAATTAPPPAAPAPPPAGAATGSAT